MSLQLDDFIFKVISYDPAFGDSRGLLIFSSANVATAAAETTWGAYRSISEMGVWRLCYSSSPSKFEKGLDYVQSSLIDFRLQELFNRIIASNGGVKFGPHYTDNAIHELMDDKTTCYYDIGSVPRRSALDKNVLIRDHLSSKDRQIKGLVDTKNIGTNEWGNPLVKGCGSTILPDTLRKLSLAIKEKYTYETIIPIYPRYSFTNTSAKGQRLDFSGDIYAFLFTDGTQLYFIKYHVTINYPDPVNPPLEKEGYGPLLATPPGTVVTGFGTYSHFLDLGGYICKIFDYQKQCTQAEQRRGLCDYDDTYIYIGDRYQDLYPYNGIKEREDGSLYYDEPVADTTAGANAGATAGGRRTRNKHKRYREHRAHRNHRTKRTKRMKRASRRVSI